jgi:hypothetical protein
MKIKNNLRILLLMPYWNPNFETRLFKLVEILRDKSYLVDFCIFTQEMNVNRELHAPGIPKQRLSLPHLAKLKPIPITSFNDLHKYVLKANFIIMGLTKDLKKLSDFISALKIPTIEINDNGEFVSYGFNPDVLVLTGEANKKNSVLNRNLSEDKIFIAGDIRFDSVVEENSESEINSFYKKYKLDKERKFAIFCSGAFQRIDKWTKALYKKIVDDLEKSSFQVVIRLHPSDYAGHKRPTGINVTSNLLLYPEVPTLEPWDITMAMKLCSFIVTVDSSVCVEASIYHKNAIVVNLHESALTDDGRKRDIFPKKRYNGCGWKTLFKDENNLRLQSEYLSKDRSQYMTRGVKELEFDWIGADCHINELPEVLKSPEILKVDEEACQRHIEKYWYKIDGKASLRIAQLTEEMINNPKFHKRIFMSLHKKMLNSLIYSISSMPKKVVGKLKTVSSKVLNKAKNGKV